MGEGGGLGRARGTGERELWDEERKTGRESGTVTVIDRLIRRMREELGVTGIVMTHDLQSAYRISDRIAMLYDGRVRTVGSVEAIRESTDPLLRAFIEGRPELMEDTS